MSFDRQIRACRMDAATNTATPYYCHKHGDTPTPCECLDAYFKAQQRTRETVRQSQTDSLEHDLLMAEAGWRR